MAEAVAIVGYACRLPGGVSVPDELWELCTRRRDGWSPIPSDRFCNEAYYHPNPLKPGTTNTTGGYFLKDDISKFDAAFFNITAKEAISMDPQQRLLLECSFEALESAGIAKQDLAGRNVGVFVGGCSSDYESLNTRDLESVPMHQATGCAMAMQSNRISHFLDLRGPSITIDVACSGSLVALHYAVRSILSGDSTEAIVGGCRLNLAPEQFVTMSMAQLLSDQGRTFAFDEEARSGFSRGEGAAVVVLKPLSAAVRDGDSIRAVILGSGVAQDGKTVGITNPNGEAQRDLITRVYQQAGVDPSLCAFAELHGTGTKVGDPIETEGVMQALSRLRKPTDPLIIGSVKSNVGHLEGASGIVSLIKAALMLEKRMLLPNTNFRTSHSAIPLDEWNLKVLSSTKPWPRGKRYVSVSNYGFGGTIAHAVLGMAPSTRRPALDRRGGDAQDPRTKLFLLSANDPESLQDRVKDLSLYLEQRPEAFEKALCANVAYTLGSRRSHLKCRVAIPATSLDELNQRMTQLSMPKSVAASKVKLVFVFTGQGAQWAQMGTALLESSSVFMACMLRADRTLRELGAEYSLLEELHKPAKVSRINEPRLSQPACTAIQIGLVNLLSSWGIEPSVVIGHSSGEIAAAFAAGAFTDDEALALAYHRGEAAFRLKEEHPELRGGMLAVGLGASEAQEFLEDCKAGYATIACLNSPTSVTVSGDVTAIEALSQRLSSLGIFNRRLMVDLAYHSEHMAKVAAGYLSAIADYLPRQASFAQFYSSVHGREIPTDQLTPEYWVQNLVKPVQFFPAMQALLQHNTSVCLHVEVGPHSALKGPILATFKTLELAATRLSYTPTLLRAEEPYESLLKTAGCAFALGASLNMTEVNFPDSKARLCSHLTDLPRYPWRRATSYWHQSRIAQNHTTRQTQRNDIIGVMSTHSNDLEPTWRHIVRLDDLPWLRQHKMQGIPVFPITGYMCMAIEALKQHNAAYDVPQQYSFREVLVKAALTLTDDEDAEMSIVLHPFRDSSKEQSSIWKDFRVYSWKATTGWVEHCRGLVKASSSSPWQHDHTIQHLKREEVARASCTTDVNSTELYQALDTLGAGYGPLFSGVQEIQSGPRACHARITVPNTRHNMPLGAESSLVIHPALFDTILHVSWPILGVVTRGLDTLYMPTGIDRAEIDASIAQSKEGSLHVWATGEPASEKPKPTKITIHAGQHEQRGYPLVTLEGLEFSPVRHGHDDSESKPRPLCFKTIKEPFNKDYKTPSESVSSSSTEIIDSPMRRDSLDETLASAVLIVDFGADKEVIVSTKESISLTLQAAAITTRLDEIVDANERRVVILQTGSKTLSTLSTQEFQNLRHLLLTAREVLWAYASEDPGCAMSVGLARTVRAESSSCINTIGISNEDLSSMRPSQSIETALSILWGHSSDETRTTDTEFYGSRGKLEVPRIIEDQDLNHFAATQTGAATLQTQAYNQGDRRLKLEIGTYGSLDTLHFTDDLSTPLGEHEIEVQVRATGVNFKDVVVCMGQIDQDYIGVECSGIVSAVGPLVQHVKPGQRVMAMTRGAYSTYARCSETSAFPISDHMTFECAASIPVVFCTAYYGLFELARLSKSETVLIHAAAGGVGQAAIMLAKHAGARILATAGSDTKKRYLMDHFDLPEENIFSSRDTSFAPAVMEATNGTGVDVVLNSLAGDLLRESWNCLAPFGRFVEIGKADITRNSRLNMDKFEQNCTFASVDLTKVAAIKPDLMRQLLLNVNALFDSGKVSSVQPIHIHSIAETENALRTLQGGKSFGKIVVVPHDDDQVQATRPKVAATLFHPDKTYVFIGGVGGIGQSLARYMSLKGARHIILTSRDAKLAEPKLRHLIDELSAVSTRLQVCSCDVANSQSVESLIQGLSDQPPLGGIVHAAMVLKDKLFEQTELTDLQDVMACKVDGTRNLHHATAGKSEQLDFFIALSSVAGIVGNRGQAGYSAANVYLDAFMAWRRSKGLKGTSIALAAVSDVGYLANGESGRKREVLKNIGAQSITEADVLALFAAAVTGEMSKTCGDECITGLDAATSDCWWVHDPRFAAIKPDFASAVSAAPAVSLRQAILTAESAGDATTVLRDAMIAKMAAVLVTPLESIQPTSTLKALGLDSLVAVEIRNWIARETEVNFQVLELLSSGSIDNLLQTILKKMNATHQ